MTVIKTPTVEHNILFELIKDYVNMYAKHFKHLTREVAIEKINSGDCGITAFTLAYIMDKYYHVKVNILDNDSHAWLELDNSPLDTWCIIKDMHMSAAYGTVDGLYVTGIKTDYASTLINHLGKNDTVGKEMVLSYLNRFGLCLEEPGLSLLFEKDIKSDLFPNIKEDNHALYGYKQTREVPLKLVNNVKIVVDNLELLKRYSEVNIERGSTITTKLNGNALILTSRDRIITRDLCFTSQKEYLDYIEKLHHGKDSARLVLLDGVKIYIGEKIVN